jgi:hypothetical protein
MVYRRRRQEIRENIWGEKMKLQSTISRQYARELEAKYGKEIYCKDKGLLESDGMKCLNCGCKTIERNGKIKHARRTLTFTDTTMRCHCGCSELKTEEVKESEEY